MNSMLSTEQSDARPETSSPRRSLILSIQLVLTAFVLGGLSALLLVNGILGNHLDIYAPHDMAAASVILDLLDNLLAYLVICGGLSILLLIVTGLVWIWHRKGNLNLLRYVVALLATALLLTAILGLGSGSAQDTIPPATPTPSATG